MSKEWSSGTWLGAEHDRRERDRRLTLREKLEWNAQSLAFAEKLKQSKKIQHHSPASLMSRRVVEPPIDYN